jgi:hypothetical protein
MSQQGFQLRSTEDLIYELCKQNPNLRFERTARGEVIIMPVGTENAIRQELGQDVSVSMNSNPTLLRQFVQ